MLRYIFVALIVMGPPFALMRSGSVEDLNAGKARRNGARPDETIRSYTLASDAGDPSRDNAAVVDNNRGTAYDDKGEYDEAIANYDAAIQLKPDYVTAYYNRGNAYDHKGDHDRAIADFDSAIRLNSDDFMAYNNRGKAYGGKEEYDRAIADFDAAIRLKPDLADAYFNRGLSYDQKGEYEKATANFDATIRLKPDFEVAYYDRGFASFLSGNFAAAVADYQRTLGINPRADYAILWLHLARGRAGQDDAAELRSNAAQVDLGTWPGPVVALYLGQATPAQVVAAAANGDAGAQRLMDCIADFYLGEDALSRHEAGRAVPLLREARNTCPHSFLEYRAAMFELNRMGE